MRVRTPEDYRKKDGRRRCHNALHGTRRWMRHRPPKHSAFVLKAKKLFFACMEAYATMPADEVCE